MDTTTCNYGEFLMFDLFFTLGAIWFAFEILEHVLKIYFAIQLEIHDRRCEDCAEQDLIREIRNK